MRETTTVRTRTVVINIPRKDNCACFLERVRASMRGRALDLHYCLLGRVPIRLRMHACVRACVRAVSFLLGVVIRRAVQAATYQAGCGQADGAP